MVGLGEVFIFTAHSYLAMVVLVVVVALDMLEEEEEDITVVMVLGNGVMVLSQEEDLPATQAPIKTTLLE